MPAEEMPQTLTEVRGDLVLAALCVGQFHAPCQIEPDRLLVQADQDLILALQSLGLKLAAVLEPFAPTPGFAPPDPVVIEVPRMVSRHVRTHVSTPDDPEGDDPDRV